MTIIEGPHHKDDIPWHEATTPSLLHRCSVQTWGVVTTEADRTITIERCACGAIRTMGRRWAERNATKLNRWRRRLGLR